MDFSNKRQTQTAGDNAVQTQIENQTINYNGVNAAEVVSIATTVYDQMYAISAKNYADIAQEIVRERIDSFASVLFPRLKEIKGALEAFKDPRFEFLLQDAQIAAAKTDREEDLNLLTELLSCHVMKGNDRKIDAGISHAIKIVDEIDNDALCALTLEWAADHLYITANIDEDYDAVLYQLNELYRKLLYLELPTGNEWLEHLDLLGCIRLSSLGHFRPFSERILQLYQCRATAGIRKDSAEFEDAIKILEINQKTESFLIDNKCLQGYVILNISNLGDIKLENKEPIMKIWNLYTKDSKVVKMAENNFIQLWNSYDSLKAVKEWRDSIPSYFAITHLGRVLAHINAKRIESSFPDLI
ncbi:MAG: hypothetical protein J6X31_07810 [Bacteroidales bacterium]|nr:hypothetical protein [Bacteroidales bacterium]MBP5680936.1 hypothetical protein [Bacteroidales bacterium]